jgi:hypothetical protein
LTVPTVRKSLTVASRSYVHQYAVWKGGLPGLGHEYNDAWYNEEAEAAAEAYLREGNPLNLGGFLAPPPINCY